ncbi:MAG: hypothetical protein H8E32_01270 [Nitrospinae bacterium]|nr:hypothetical protein [Nitrospinota bacterium]MBL7019441.1 hypothetical protein [Nitrospinaceae bacterium]
MKNNGFIQFWLLSSLLLSSCATAPGNIFNTFSTDDGNSLTTGSRQRIINNVQPGLGSFPGVVAPNRIVCSEPSPDVAVAVANSFGAAISIMGQGSGSVTSAQAEGIAQLAERTVTVQLLRDQSYRACEAYANGAITGTTYSLIMGELNDTMVTLLLGENTAGAFGRSLAALGTKASSTAKASVEGFSGALKDIEEATKKLSEAEGNIQIKEASLKDKQDLLKAAKEENDETARQEQVDIAEKELTTAKLERDAIATQLKGKLDTTSESVAELTKLAAGGGITRAPSDRAVEILGQLQKEFLDKGYSDRIFSACLVELGRTNVGNFIETRVTNVEQKIEQYLNYDDRLVNGTENPASQHEKTKGLKEILKELGLTRRSDIHDLVRLGMSTYGNARISALNNYCQKNLQTLVKKDSENRQTAEMAHLNIKLKKLNNEAEQLKTAQLVEANKTESLKITQAGEFRKSVEACLKVDKTIRGDCLKFLIPSQKTQPTTPPTDPLQATVDELKVAVLPIQDFNLATKTMGNLISEHTKLSNLTIPAPSITNGITAELRTIFITKRTTLSGKIGAAITKAQADLSSGGTLQSKLEVLQKEHHDLLNILAGVNEEPTRKVLVSKLQLQRANSEAEKSNLVKMINSLKELTTQTTALIEEIKAVS